MRQIELKDLNLGQEQWTPEQGQQATQQIRKQLQQANLPAEKLVEIGQWAERVIQDPGQFPEFQAWLREQGLPESDIPKEPDYQELSSMVAIGRVASDMQAEQQPAAPTAAAPTGPVSPEQMQSMAGQGRMGDTMLAHINPTEAAVLESMGGVGTINPATGLPEYGFFSDLWNGIKKVAKAIAPIALPAIAIFAPALIPAVGTALGASAALAPVVGAAAIAGGVTLLSGGSIKDALSSAAFTGLGAYLSPIIGDYVGNVVGITDAGLKSAIGTATLAGGITALRGGTVSQILTAAATGAAANYLSQIASEAIGGITNTRVTQKPFDDSVFLAADAEQLAAQGLGKNQITEILQSTGVSSQVAETAATAATQGLSAGKIASTVANRYGSGTTLYSNNATGVERSIVGGGNVKALENVQMAEDAMFVAIDAQNLRAQGLSETQIRQTLEASGVDPKVARMAAGEAWRGATLDAAAQSITYAAESAKVPVFGEGSRVIGGGVPTTTGKTPSAPSAPAVDAGKLADAEFLAADALQLRAQGLSQDQIQSTLVQSGATQQSAYTAAVGAVRGTELGALTNNIAGSQFDVFTPGTSPTQTAPVAPAVTGSAQTSPVTSPTVTETPIAPGTTAPAAPTAPAPGYGNLTEAQFMAADAYQMAQQGLGTQDIMNNLIASGANPNAAMTAASAAGSGFNQNLIASQITIVNGTANLYGPPPAPSDITTLPEVVVTADREPAFVPQPQPGGNTSEAEFIAADAAQLAAQTNNNTAAVEQNLVYAGVDPVTAATAANMAVSGATIPEITQAITNQPGFVTPEPTPAPAPEPVAPQEPLGGGLSTENLPVGEGYELVGESPTPPGYQEGDLGTGITEPVYPNLPEMGGGQGIVVPGVTPEITTPVLTPDLTPPLSNADLGAIAATPTIPNPLEPVQPPGRPDMGTFTPAPPDPSWSRALQYPGVNPGLVGAAIRPAYATTSPVQSQYYWGRQPYFAYTEDLDRYNQVAMPTTPFGIQQGYFEQPAIFAPMPVYDPNMFIQPQPQAMLSSQAFAAPQAQTAQAIYPQQLFPIAPQMVPESANYIYDIRPTAAQYSIPAASPV